MSITKKLGFAALVFAATFLVPLAAFAQDEKASNMFDVRSWAAVGATLMVSAGVVWLGHMLRDWRRSRRS